MNQCLPWLVAIPTSETKGRFTRTGGLETPGDQHPSKYPVGEAQRIA
jgi:hypothetical protein